MKKLDPIQVEPPTKGHEVSEGWEAQALLPAPPLGQDLGSRATCWTPCWS